MGTLADLARKRIREALAAEHISQRDIGSALGCSQSCVGKILTGRTALSVDDVEKLCQLVHLSPVEAFRDPGLEFVADMTPTELRILERFRQLPATTKAAILELLNVKAPTGPDRYARAPKPKPLLGKARRDA